MMKKRNWATVLAILCLLGSCAFVTINVYFTPQEIQKAADRIEDRVRGEVLEEETEEIQEPQSKAGSVLFEWLCSTAYAQEGKEEKIDLNINTPKIEEIVDRRARRFKRIDELLNEAVIGEGLDGYLIIRDIKSLDLKEIPKVRQLVKQENEDRKKLYESIAEANEIPEEKVEEIARNWAITIRKKLKPGQYYQMKKDDKVVWVQKKKDEDKEKEAGGE